MQNRKRSGNRLAAFRAPSQVPNREKQKEKTNAKGFNGGNVSFLIREYSMELSFRQVLSETTNLFVVKICLQGFGECVCIPLVAKKKVQRETAPSFLKSPIYRPLLLL